MFLFLSLGKKQQKQEKHRGGILAVLQRKIIFTLPETNIAHVGRPSQKKTHLPTIDFQGLC